MTDVWVITGTGVVKGEAVPTYVTRRGLRYLRLDQRATCRWYDARLVFEGEHAARVRFALAGDYAELMKTTPLQAALAIANGEALPAETKGAA